MFKFWRCSLCRLKILRSLQSIFRKVYRLGNFQNRTIANRKFMECAAVDGIALAVAEDVDRVGIALAVAEDVDQVGIAPEVEFFEAGSS